MSDVGADRDRGVGPPGLNLACPSCGANSGSTRKFCGECGARLARVIPSAEYKQVTVLFADVVGSMEIAAAVDAERYRETMTELVERSAGVVQRYGGTVEYTGDGVMAIFGAPMALEDHAFRACLAALAIQKEAARLAAAVARRDGVALWLRVGVHSGRVIAGEVGSGSLRYAATGETVGFAQRMESVAPPGGVVVSEATARLVEPRMLLDDQKWLHIKGFAEPVPARRLMGIRSPDKPVARTEASLVGRRAELAALDAMVDRAIGGHGGVVNVVGPPGIGKSRTARETAALAVGRGAAVHWTFCESHAGDIPFRVMAQLLRVRLGVAGLDGEAARARVRAQFPDAEPDDLLLFDDLLGVSDAGVPPPQIDADARRRRLTALVDATFTRTEPALIVVEDAQWIDAASESMISELLTEIPHTSSLVLITSRPEYRGELRSEPGGQSISLAPLGDSDTAALVGELLGPDCSVTEVGRLIAERAAGNPFFAEEMVRELAQRGVLAGERGGYTCRADPADLYVPGTVEAAIEARIDQLTAPAKRTLNAASVMGARFDAKLLAALGIDPVLDELLAAELIDEGWRAGTDYAFRHPLIRAVAYESQLKSDRAQWHRRLAAAIQEADPGAVEENAALIAEHLESAGEPHAAYGWHMRAGAWSTNRNLAAARVSWERAGRIADTLRVDDRDQLSMRIAPRAMLCATDWQARDVQDSRGRFEELRGLCKAAGDNVSLVVGMTALAAELCYAARTREAAQLSSEQMALLESIGDPTPTMGLVFLAFVNWLGVGEFGEILRWSQTIIDLAAGDPARGAGFGMGSPLAIASAWRGTARWWLGRPGWRQDLGEAVALARRSNAETLSGAVAWSYGFAMQYGVLRVDDSAVRACEEAVQTARKASSDRALGLAAYTLAVGLLNRDAAADRFRGLELMMQTRDIWLRKRAFFLIPVTDLWAARETARRGDREAAIPVMRHAVDELCRSGHLFYGLWATGVLVETLLERGAGADVGEAGEAIDRAANLWPPDDSPVYAIMSLRLRTLLARARGDRVAHRDLVIRYRAMATELGFDGHIAWAAAMAERAE